MTDLLKREDQVFSGERVKASETAQRKTWLPVELYEVSHAESVQNDSEIIIEWVEGQQDLLTEGYTPFREPGTKGIVHMVHTYVHHNEALNWSSK